MKILRVKFQLPTCTILLNKFSYDKYFILTESDSERNSYQNSFAFEIPAFMMHQCL